jgi:hypothetical protein
MLSPFPGMDPWLDGPLWSSVHFQLSAEIARQLAPRLAPKYLALSNERFVLTSPDTDAVAIAQSSMYPDTAVFTSGAESAPGSATAVEPAPLHLATVMPESTMQITIEIRDTANRHLVTAIEVLSPTNKSGEGFREYVIRRQRYLLSTTHLIEIDLLRSGRRVPMREPLPRAPYFVLLSRAERRPDTEVWPIELGAPLPTVAVPLLPGDDDVPLDLQPAFAAVYDGLRYDLAVDYTRPAPVPLRGTDEAWAEERILAWRPKK